MTIPRIHVIVAMVLAIILLTACELPASTPPPPVSTIDAPMATLQSELGIIATQTAAAQGEPVDQPTQPPTEGEPGVPTPEDSATEPVAEPTFTPAVSTPLPVSSPTPGIPTTYQLQDGEHPYCIARRFDVDQTELLNLNGLGPDARPEIGFVLQIPQTGNPFVGSRSLREHPTTYTVSAGDTIYAIACLFGAVSPEAIAEANGLSSPYTLTPGQVINIP
ncbi:MAG: LysM peptidoglycan-binding domain-containing protein [Anaerolineales bacterium]|nr:LysM peptidoglycan-binding domain-containing protein [Anaerolineales bacterium]